jgi:hypothetical protein
MELTTYKKAKNKYQELKNQFIEMAQLKSNFDIEKFTVKSKSNFIAHNFHFLMRQYSLALYELRRILIDIEEKNRRIEEYKELQNEGKTKIERKYIDLEIEKLKNEIDLQELSLKNKYEMCSYFEKARQKLIEMNNGKPITNKQYQAEEPKYWKWYLERKAVIQSRQRTTGIDAGVWENIEHLEQPALINTNFQVSVLDDLGRLDLTKANIDNESRKGLVVRVKKLLNMK